MEKAVSLRTSKRVAFFIEFLLLLIPLRILFVGLPLFHNDSAVAVTEASPYHKFHLKLSVLGIYHLFINGTILYIK